MSAADIIKSWSDQLAQDGYMLGMATAAQAGNPGVPSETIAAFAPLALRRAGDGSIADPEVFLFFSDRTVQEQGVSIRQPFAANQVDNSEFRLTLQGQLIMKSDTWGGSETVELVDVGNGLLAGFGNSIGNNGAPAYWAVTVDGQVRHD